MASIQLKNGEFTSDQRLDCVRQVDIRSLAYPVQGALDAEAKKVPRSRTWRLDVRLDQGSEGACVGFGWTHELAASPVAIKEANATFARKEVYWEAQKIDEWPGGAYPGASPQYEGTSVLAGAKVVKRLGFIDSYRWALSPKDLVAAVGHLGPAVIGVDWYEGMFDTDADGFIHPTGQIRGGHCICVVGVKVVKKDRNKPSTYSNLDPLRTHFVLVNSWGKNWGEGGACKLALIDLMKLWPGGSFCLPLGRRRP